MIKDYKYTGILLIAFLALSSCRKDVGNYAYNEINDIEITGVNSTYSAVWGSNLTITPELSFTKDKNNDTTKYAYEWFAVVPRTGNTADPKVLSRNRNLNWVVNLPATDASYQVYYIVKEKATGVIWRKIFSVKVTTNIADGWLVLNEIDNEPRLDFFNYLSTSDSYQYYKDILSSFSTLKLEGKPQMLYFYQRRDAFSNKTEKSIFVGTDKHTFVINTTNFTFSEHKDLVNLMAAYVAPPFYAKSVISIGGPLAYMYDNSGKLYFENPTSGIAFGSGINRTITGEPIQISPFIAEGLSSTQYALMYDTENKKFMEHKNINLNVSVPAVKVTPPATPLFDPGNMDMDLVYMASTRALSNQTYAVLKNNMGKIFLARISCNATAFVPLAFEELTTAPQIANATKFAIDPSEGYLMYVAGSKVYRYNVVDKSNTVVVDLGTRKVSLLKYQKMVYAPGSARYMEYANKLIICSYDTADPNASGKMDLYSVPNLNGDLKLYKTFDGLGKIVDVSYRE
ncbi:hypothetical protein ABIE26_004225 [Pedobacter africanus]|uniref:Uncharacterized protein n=1 Tax=Pedobacter africanus TaxID=151894 RepID=A0ACC6L1K0_9SPHI|nr:PKD-like family lipoprotein [Pedobacter africanus]MDR6785515.1 hypothetical protein [Pedobacter africanus]